MTTDTPAAAEPKARTIGDAISDAVQQPTIGEGGDARVFRFVDPALADYVLRANKIVRPKSIRAVLQNSSQLKTPSLFPRGAEMGQWLMVSDESPNPVFAVMRAVPGKSLEQWFEQSKQEGFVGSHIARYAQDAGQNPFAALFETVYRATKAGFNVDTGLGNILYDARGGDLRLIDQRAHVRGAGKPKKAMEAIKTLAGELRESFIAASHETDALATQQCVTLIDEAESMVKQNHNSYAPLAFGVVHRVEAAKMADTPHALKAKLDALHAQAQGQVR